MTPVEISKLKMNELCDALEHCENAQNNIYQTYERAAEMDEAMRELKQEEKYIRMYMQSKIGI